MQLPDNLSQKQRVTLKKEAILSTHETLPETEKEIISDAAKSLWVELIPHSHAVGEKTLLEILGSLGMLLEQEASMNIKLKKQSLILFILVIL